MRTFMLVLLPLALAASAASAQTTAPTPLTVEDAVARALDTSHRLAEALAREESSRASVASRDAASRPTITVSGGYTRTNHVDAFGVPQPDGRLRIIYPDIPDNYFTRASLQWPIYTAGRVDTLVRAAEAEARAAEADVTIARADLRLEVVRAYWAVATAAEAVQVVEQSLARADAHLRDMRSRFDNGLIPPNEVTAVEAQRARQQMQLIETRNTHANAVEDLRRLTGVAGEIVTIEPLSAATAAAADAAPTPDPAARAEHVALEERIAAAEARVRSVEANRKPTVSFTAGADYANPNARIFPRDDIWRSSWEVGVVGTWTIWDGGRTDAAVAEAAAASKALRARLADVDALIASDIRQRQRDLDSARAAEAAADAAVESAAETRRVVGERFEVGVATSTELLDAQVALLQADLDRTRARANIRLAEARLRRATGG